MSSEESSNSWNPKRFDGSEYSKFRLRFMLFIKKKEWNSVLEVERPTNDANKTAAWDKLDVKVQSTLVNAVSDRILDEIQHETTAVGMVSALDAVYLRKTLMMRVLAKRNLLNLKMLEGEDVQEFFGKFEKHISALRDAGEKISVEEKLSYLLLILPDRYAHIIDVIDALPIEQHTVDYIKGKLLFDHCKTDQSSSLSNDTMALKTQVINRNRGKSSTGPPGPNYRCHRCGIPGHFRRDCRVDLANLSTQNTNGNPASNDERWRSNRRNVASNNIEVTDADANVFQVRVLTSQSANAEESVRNSCKLSWILDSGCTNHIVTSDLYFCVKTKLDSPALVKVADGFILQASYIGNIRLYTLVNNIKVSITLKDVYYTPELGYNLISFDGITRAGFSIFAKGNTAEIRNTLDHVIGVAVKSSKLYHLTTFVSNDVFCSSVDVSGNSLGTNVAEEWHRKLGHVNFQDLKTLCSNKLLDGLPEKLNSLPRACDICLESKFANLKHTTVRARATQVLELVHSDVNFVTPLGYKGEIGFVSFIDDFSRMARVYCIKSKSEIIDKFVHYVNTMSNLMNSRVKMLRCDRGTEYINKNFEKFCSSLGILIRPSPSYVHELNGTAERFNRTILDRARCLRLEANLDKRFWPECVKTAAYLGNRLLANTEEQKSPFEIFFGKKPNVTNLKCFGVPVFVRIPDVKRKFKIDSKAERGVLVGYAENGYRVLINGDVKETPYVRLAEQKPSVSEIKENNCWQLIEESGAEEEETCEEPSRIDIEQQTEETTQEACDQQSTAEHEELETSNREISSRPIRERKMPDRYGDFIVKVHLCTCSYVPTNFKEAMSGEDAERWKVSMNEEMENMQKYEVWDLVEPPQNCKIIPVKWVYRVKSSGKLKSRLVAVGFRQPHEVDEDTYSPVAAMTSLRIVLSVSCRFGLHIHQMDVEGAFLNGDVKGQVYVSQPKGYEQENGKVYKLKKALYGLRESPRAWYNCFHLFMLQLNFKCSDYDSCLYVKFTNNILLGLILYVDDLLIFSQDIALVTELKNDLKHRFCMTDLGVINNYLGITVNYNREAKEMKLDQTQYIDSLVEKYGVHNMRTFRTPMERNLSLPFCENTNDFISEYRRLIGALLFVSSGTRIDIAYAVNYLSRFQRCATSTHFKYALRVLKYLQVTRELKVVLKPNSKQEIEAWADADWAADSHDRKSTSGILIRVFGNPIIWICRKQNSVARASTYAEYIALADAVSELFQVTGILENLGIKISGPIPVYEDNSSAIALANKGKFTKKAKHIEVAYKFVADYVEKGLVKVCKVDSQYQIADILTKALGSEKFIELRKAVSIR